MKSAIDAVVGRTRTALIAFLVIVMAGVFSYISLPKEAEPDIEIPFVFIEIALEGVSPEQFSSAGRGAGCRGVDGDGCR